MMRQSFTGTVLALAFAALPLFLFATGGRAADPPRVEISNIALQHHNGETIDLANYDSVPVLAIAFLGTECPLARLYARRLQALHEEYDEREVAFLAVNANCQDTLQDIREFAREFDLSLPMLKDADQRLADLLGAERTPEVFVLDASRRVRYSGRIDDQYLIGVQRSEPGRQDLREAISELQKNVAVSVPRAPAVGCLIGRRPSPNEDSEVTYSKQIARLFQEHCVDCHRPGDVGPFPLASYDDVIGWGETILEAVQSRRMPPWHADPRIGTFKNDCRLSEADIQLVETWVGNGCPQGDPAELPPPREYNNEWNLSRDPDTVLTINPEPFVVPAHAPENGIPYQYHWVDPGFAEDRWVRELAIRPGNPAVVHHILIYVLESGRTGEVREALRTGRTLAVHAPGVRPMSLPDGAARRIPAGSWLLFEVHYHATGREEIDVSECAMNFADADEVTHEVFRSEIVNLGIDIRPFRDNQVFHAESAPSGFDVEILALAPHMHLRGKSFTFELKRPSGARQTLLRVPRYYLHWQRNYELATPIKAPAGSVLSCTAVYDNSEKNLQNPDPSARVGWGEQSWDEMFVGYVELLFPIEHSGSISIDRTPRR